ncbi:VOC family protein [Miltoncostaea marina]|uniref:VOC family protein n=1 Tax=Miltoncostaea marina TaxID=2843215 RepID=UPI001C3E558E|nr:VOC family protein [Miltoncostaea marina]
MSLPDATTMGPVRLVAADLDAMAAFYRRAVGLADRPSPAGEVHLGVGGRTLVELAGDPAATPRPHRTTGLFHLALLVPSRADLAQALHRVSGAGWRFSGASDHLVSEALYLDDPEGNGIEIYRDRPREEWPRRDGELLMDTLPMDVEGVLAELPPGTPDEGMPEGTTMGHVHLQVRDLDEAETFYAGLLGFDVTVRGYPGALFVSAGGYHHHLGLNTWGTRDAPAPPPGSRGLNRVRIDLPSAADVAAAGERLRAAGREGDELAEGLAVADPSGNRLLLVAAA